MKPLNPQELAYWNRYLATLPEAQRKKEYAVEANIAGNLEIADQLLALYLKGKKTAASSLLQDYLTVGDPLPEPGRYWIVLDSKLEPRCIVKTLRTETHKFRDIPEYVAKGEGEGDLSLAYWRKAHIWFFTPFLKEWGVEDLEEADVIVEFFELVYKQ